MLLCLCSTPAEPVSPSPIPLPSAFPMLEGSWKYDLLTQRLDRELFIAEEFLVAKGSSAYV